MGGTTHEDPGRDRIGLNVHVNHLPLLAPAASRGQGLVFLPLTSLRFVRPYDLHTHSLPTPLPPHTYYSRASHLALALTNHSGRTSQLRYAGVPCQPTPHFNSTQLTGDSFTTVTSYA